MDRSRRGTDKNAFMNALEDILQRTEMTQGDVAAKLEMASQNISRMLNDPDATPGHSVMEKFAAVLDPSDARQLFRSWLLVKMPGVAGRFEVVPKGGGAKVAEAAPDPLDGLPAAVRKNFEALAEEAKRNRALCKALDGMVKMLRRDAR